MKRIATAGAFALILMTPAFAADLPSRAAPPVYVPPPIPVFSWTGFYAGVQGGYAFGKDNSSALATVRGRAPVGGEGGGGRPVAAAAEAAAPAAVVGLRRTRSAFADLSSSPSGVVGGGHVGYNFSTAQILGGSLGPAGIFGIEGDAEGLDSSKTVYVGTAYSRIKNDLQGSIRGRLGIGFDRFLVYGTGGAAFAEFKSTYGFNAAVYQGFDTTRVGYTVGGGVEYAFTNNWSLRAEYRYSDFGSFTNTITLGAASVVVHHHDTDQRVEGGISYLFTTPVAPAVVARY